MKVLLIGYALSPLSGSEPAIGWGWASGLARAHDVTVVSRMNNRNDVVAYLKKHPELKLEVKWVDSGTYTGPMAASLIYLGWLQRAARLCRELVTQHSFDLVHLVSYGSLNIPNRFGELGIPFVLGPGGGGQTLDPMYQEVLGPMPLSDRLRNIRIALLPYRSSIKRMVRTAALVLTT